MPVLVTGGGGFVGLHLLRALRAAGAQELAATVLGELPPPDSPPGGVEGVTWLSMDVSSPESVREVVESVQPRVVYHLAGQASVGQSFEAPLETWEVNATGTLRVMTALRQASVQTKRLLLISSAEVYGTVPLEEQPIREDARFRPVTPYGASKAAAEMVAGQVAREADLELVIARSFNHIGPGQDERFVLPSMARQLVRIRSGEMEPVLKVGNLEVERDLLDVRDVVRAYVLLMERGEAGEAYNVSSGSARSLLEVVRRMVELSETGARLEVDRERVRPVDIPRLVGDPGKLRGLSWRPREPLDRTLRDLLAEAERRS